MLQISKMFGDNMVLQQGKRVKVWGSADAKAPVTVEIQGKTAQTLADEKGDWMAELEPLQVSTEERMQITCGADTITFHNVMVGEVWLAGGQSNMEFYMHYDKDFEEERTHCENPLIRFYDYPEVTCERSARERDFSEFGFWRTCDIDNLDYFSAVGYYFARELQKSLQVPIGIVGCNCGGTRSCCWMDEETVAKCGPVWVQDYENGLNAIPDLKQAEEKYFGNPMMSPVHPFDNPMKEKMMKGIPLEELLQCFAGMGESGGDVIGPWHEWRPSGLYHMMLEQVMPYTMKGVIYYQGESDEDHPEIYADMLEGLIGLWREKWGEEFPFIMTQLAPLEEVIENGGKYYPILRDQMELAAKRLHQVWVASIGDVGHYHDIHPKEKQPVGVRLALLARGHVYGEDILCEAPVPAEISRDGNQIVVTFANAEGGLEVRGDQINALQIFGEDGSLLEDWKAEIAGERMKISLGKATRDAKQIRFARTSYYVVNVYNRAGVPVKPFVLKV